MASMMCKALWGLIIGAHQAIGDYIHATVSRAFGVPYPPPARQEPIYLDDEFDVYIEIPYDPALAAHGRLRLWRIQRNGGTFTAYDWQRLLARDKQCLRCGTTDNLSRDHVVPVAKGGSHAYSNAQVLCTSCNSWKHTKIIDYRQKGKI